MLARVTEPPAGSVPSSFAPGEHTGRAEDHGGERDACELPVPVRRRVRDVGGERSSGRRNRMGGAWPGRPRQAGSRAAPRADPKPIGPSSASVSRYRLWASCTSRLTGRCSVQYCSNEPAPPPSSGCAVDWRHEDCQSSQRPLPEKLKRRWFKVGAGLRGRRRERVRCVPHDRRPGFRTGRRRRRARRRAKATSAAGVLRRTAGDMIRPARLHPPRGTRTTRHCAATSPSMTSASRCPSSPRAPARSGDASARASREASRDGGRRGGRIDEDGGDRSQPVRCRGRRARRPAPQRDPRAPAEGEVERGHQDDQARRASTRAQVRSAEAAIPTATSEPMAARAPSPFQ